MISLHSCYMMEYDTWQMTPSRCQYHILILITSGKIIYWVDNESVVLQKGDVLYIPVGSIRGGTANASHQRHATHFSISDDEAQLPLLLKKQFYRIRLSNFDYFKQRFMLLNQNWLEKRSYSSVMCNAVLLEMLTILNRDLDNLSISSKRLKVVEETKEYILENFKESITLKDLAEHTDRTPNHISHIFKEVTGFSPIEYLHYVRISEAKDLMLSQLMPIREVAEQTGFYDQAYFNRIFKKISGCSPTDFLNGKINNLSLEKTLK